MAAAGAILKAFNLAWTNVDIRERLQNAAVDLGACGRDDAFGFGLLDIRGALDGEGPPTCGLIVEIDGPTVVPDNTTCAYFADVSGGTGAYSYQWYRNAVPIGTDSPFVEVFTGDVDSYNVRVEVTDPGAVGGSDELHAVVSASAPPCFT